MMLFLMQEEENLDESPLLSDLFMELASETRFSILVSLNKKPAKLSTLKRARHLRSGCVPESEQAGQRGSSEKGGRRV
jgi:hypothetical protein